MYIVFVSVLFSMNCSFIIMVSLEIIVISGRQIFNLYFDFIGTIFCKFHLFFFLRLPDEVEA